jgi:hypothetical protein
MFDICSSLALLHSRRSIHRDISPRNIRCTTRGSAKLIDFGAMSAMGASAAQLVGTPAFTAPEAVQHSSLDARSDLFSLGATLYYALTQRLPFAARTFAEAVEAWNVRPRPPSSSVPDIPAALDDLVLSLLNLEPALRPQSAFEVMQRLAAIAKLPRSEPEGVTRSYLSTPTLVGRDDVIENLRARLTQAQHGRGGGVLVRGEAGLGRSRVLDAMAIEAKTLGTSVLRASPNGAREPFATALLLVEYALEALPTSVLTAPIERLCGRPPMTEPGERLRHCMQQLVPSKHDPAEFQQRLCDFLIGVSQAQPLLLAVDDVQLIDEPSAALMAELIERTQRQTLLVAATALADNADVRAIPALARRCTELELRPLDREQSHALLASMFGDVPNLALLANELFDIARGNPQQIIAVAQHLLDKGLIGYASGVWTLPATLAATDMPRSAEAAIAARIAALSATARALGEAHALAYHDTVSRAEYYALQPKLPAGAIDNAILELEQSQALKGDGQTYVLSSRIWSAAFRAGTSPEVAARHHNAWAASPQPRSPMAVIHHVFGAGRDEEALDALLRYVGANPIDIDIQATVRMHGAKSRPSYMRALQTAERLGRPERVKHDLRRWLLALSIITADYDTERAAQWLERLKLDSGWNDWQADIDHSDPGQRLMRAYQAAEQRHLQTPEPERVYRVDEAIRLLAEFVGFSIAISARVHDFALMESLPALLEPFAPLSPVIDSLWQNALAGRDAYRGRYYSAHARWKQVHARLGEVRPADVRNAETIRNAVAFGVGLFEAFMGFPTADDWAAQLDRDPLQHLSALSIRRIVHLGQGKWHEADRIRRQIEVLALQARAPQMFNSLLSVEQNAFTAGRDLVGLRGVIAQLRPLAAKYPGWQGDLHLAQARFESLRGDLSAAQLEFERCLEVVGDPSAGAPSNIPAWIAAQAGLVEVLLAMVRGGDARARANTAWAIMRALEIDADDLSHALALALASCGDFEAANARLDEIIANQVARGISGLRLGLSYEARAQVAIWADDEDAFATYAFRTAREYRHGAGSPLGTRYERLMNQAQRRNFKQSVVLAPFQNASNMDSTFSTALVAQALAGAPDAGELAQRALRLICNLRGAECGHLYLLHGEEVTLVAEHGKAHAPSTLLEQVHAYLIQERKQNDLATVVESDVATTPDRPLTGAFAADSGYRLLLLNTGRGGESRVVAVAAVTDEGPQLSAAGEPHVLEAIAARLVAATEPNYVAYPAPLAATRVTR